MPVGERLEDLLEPVGVGFRERGLSERRAALHERQFDHDPKDIENT